MLARELLNKPDGFLTVTYGDKEYVIENIMRTRTHANLDDSMTYWTLNLRDCSQGNLKI